MTVWYTIYRVLCVIHDALGCEYAYPHLCNLVEYAYGQSTLKDITE